MNGIIRVAATITVAVCATVSANAAGLMDSLKGAASEKLGGGSASNSSGSLLGGLGLPSIGGNTANNAAGVLQYCIKNNYLSGSGAEGVKDSLLSKVGLGGKEKQDSGYRNGAKGILSGSDGSSFDLGKVKSNVKEKACDYVLNNAKSLL
jgi:hypothetical protein